MKSSIWLVIFLIFCINFNLVAQDHVYLKDGSKINGKVIKVNFKTIEIVPYSSSYSQILKANNVALINYGNGEHQVINRRVKCRLNFNLNLLFNNTFSNWPYQSQSLSSLNNTYYWADKGRNRYSSGLNGGFNFLIGRRKNTNLFISTNFTFSQSAYIREVHQSPPDNSNNRNAKQITHDNVASSYAFINFCFGPHFRLFNFMILECGLTFNSPFWAKNVLDGYVSISDGTSSTVDTYENKIDHTLEITSAWSTFINLGYDFQCYGKRTGLFVSGTYKFDVNNNHTNWLMVGLRFYPFDQKSSNEIK